MSWSGDLQHYKYDLTNHRSRPWRRALVICEAEWNGIRKLPVCGSMQWKKIPTPEKRQGRRRSPLFGIVAQSLLYRMLPYNFTFSFADINLIVTVNSLASHISSAFGGLPVTMCSLIIWG